MDFGERLARLKRQVAEVPTLPGVYLWKNAEGEVIYVGKAKQLRARMRQYVNFDDNRAKIPLLVEQIDSFEYIVAENEHEALVLEKNLINRYSPYFNADFKDDKSYPFIAITKGDMFPAIKYTRERHRAGTRYFGPYTDPRAARTLIEVIRRVCPICSATCADWRHLARKLEGGSTLMEASSGAKACFDHHVGLGPGVCCGACTREEYLEAIARVERFLAGHYREFIDELSCEMRAAAAELDFERASRLKQRLDTITSLTTKQTVEVTGNLNADVLGFFREETIAGVNVFVVRDGITVNSNEFILNKGNDIPDEELARMFLLRYYDTTESIPREIVVRDLPEDAETLEDWLSGKLASKHGARVRLTKPERGPRAELLEMAERNAKHVLLRYKVRSNYDDDRSNVALLQLESALALPAPPMRIECFDISTIHGSYTVASMVVFTGGKADKSQYRRFKIRTPLDEANDFLSMQEVLERRYSPERLADGRFGARPDLVILDGGKPQLTVAVESFSRLGIEDISLVGLA
ncbi:MAG: excinuclease ABC subunit UvrC, partial [Eggerthellaceae bacterium]|nr:excinuclease ABC subunit UvrC [Eggerthellaceae bacterium]